MRTIATLRAELAKRDATIAERNETITILARDVAWRDQTIAALATPSPAADRGERAAWSDAMRAKAGLRCANCNSLDVTESNNEVGGPLLCLACGHLRERRLVETGRALRDTLDGWRSMSTSQVNFSAALATYDTPEPGRGEGQT